MEKRLNVLQALGCLEIKFWRSTFVKRYYGIAPSTEENPSATKVYEKALKGRAVELKTNLGPAVVQPGGKRFNTRTLDAEDEPYLHFKFLYRSVKHVMLPNNPLSSIGTY